MAGRGFFAELKRRHVYRAGVIYIMSAWVAIQVMRRLKAMLEELLGAVPESRRPAVSEELARLDVTVARSFADSVDLTAPAAPTRRGWAEPARPD